MPDSTPPVISNESPSPGAVAVDITAHVSFDVTDAGSGVNPAATLVYVSGGLAWSGDAPATGWTGTRTVVGATHSYDLVRTGGFSLLTGYDVDLHVEDLDGNSHDHYWIFTTEVFHFGSVVPAVVDSLGGTELAIAGSFPLDQPIFLYLGPLGTSGDAPCYAGEGGGYLGIYSEDGVALSCIVPPAVVGPDWLTLVCGATTRTAAMTVVDHAHYGTVFSARRDFPPWAKVGPRRLEEA